MSPGTQKIVVWAVIAVVAFVVLRRIGIAALFGKTPTPADQPTIFGGGGAGSGVTAPNVTPTPVVATQAQLSVTGDPVGTVALKAVPAVSTTATDSGSWLTKLDPRVATDRPATAVTLVQPTTVQSTAPGRPQVTVTDPKSGMAYDPVFGLYDVGAINRNAYQTFPASQPALGDVYSGGKKIGRQTATGFYGG